MVKFPIKLQKKLEKRIKENAFRTLTHKRALIDFSSNDYLGLAREKNIKENIGDILKSNNSYQNGSTGSRLLSGNNSLYTALEDYLAEFYHAESALIFNSGYNANLGFFASVPQRNDIILYDEKCHASIRDGIGLSLAKSFKFKHNDLNDLSTLIKRIKVHQENDVYLVTESIFSMDGDSPNLDVLVNWCQKNKIHLIVDEAHAVGVFDKGIIAELNLEHDVFARVVTFGKAFGAHGAAILGSSDLKDFLINFCRSFIYTTAPSPHTIATIWAVHQFLSSNKGKQQIKILRQKIDYFRTVVARNDLESYFCDSNSPIQVYQISGNKKVKKWSNQLELKGFDVQPILSPTVTGGEERLRFCLHTFNTKADIEGVLDEVKKILNEK